MAPRCSLNFSIDVRPLYETNNKERDGVVFQKVSVQSFCLKERVRIMGMVYLFSMRN